MAPPGKRNARRGDAGRLHGDFHSSESPISIAPRAVQGKGIHLRIAEISDGFEVALHGVALGKLFRISVHQTRLEAVDRAVLEEHERGVPLIIDDGAEA